MIPWKSIWKFMKRNFSRIWYLALLIVSSIYVIYYRFEIYSLTEINARNLVFLLWLLLLLLPLISEMEFFGIKVKKEVEKATDEIRKSIQVLQSQIVQMSMTSTVHFNLGGPLITEQRMKELEDENLKNTDSNKRLGDERTRFPGGQEKSVALFKARLGIETALRDICERTDYSGRPSLMSMVTFLEQRHIIRRSTAEMIREVVKIANRGVHGEIVDDKYMWFVENNYPLIMNQLLDSGENTRYTICPRCGYSGTSIYDNVCPNCGSVYDEY